MGTRCLIKFKDEYNTFTVYKHWDGYPSNILPLIEKAKTKAWELPRFEADEFATAFISVAKPDKGGGDVRLCNNNADLGQEYIYTVSLKDNKLDVKVDEL